MKQLRRHLESWEEFCKEYPEELKYFPTKLKIEMFLRRHYFADKWKVTVIFKEWSDLTYKKYVNKSDLKVTAIQTYRRRYSKHPRKLNKNWAYNSIYKGNPIKVFTEVFNARGNYGKWILVNNNTHLITLFNYIRTGNF